MFRLSGPVEKRKEKRFKVFDDTFAVPIDYASKMGQILDISRGGLSFNYLDDEQPCPETFKLDVLLSGYGRILKGIPVEVISNFVSEGISPFTLMRMCRCGVKFLNLGQKRESQLEYFIMNNTVDGFRGICRRSNP